MDGYLLRGLRFSRPGPRSGKQGPGTAMASAIEIEHLVSALAVSYPGYNFALAGVPGRAFKLLSLSC